MNFLRGKRRTVLRRAIICVLVVVAIGVVWNTCNRISSMAKDVSIYELHDIKASNQQGFAGKLTLATLNIAHGRGTNELNISFARHRRQRLQKIAQILQDKKVDLAVLQEVDFDATWTGREDQAKFIARAAGFKYVLEQCNFDVAFPFVRLRWGTAILSNYRIRDAHFVHLPVHSKMEHYVAGSKQASYADVEIATNLNIRVFAVHMEPREENTRVRCADSIITAATTSKLPFFCIGDFNSAPASFPGSTTDAHGSTLLDTLLKSNLFQTRPTNFVSKDQLTWKSYDPTELDDWIMVPISWNIAAYNVINNDVSDHRFVIMTVTPPDER